MRPTLALVLLTVIYTSSCKKDVKPNEGTILTKIQTKVDDGSSSYRVFERNSLDKITWLRDWYSASGSATAVQVEYGTDGKVKSANTFDNSGNKLYFYEFEYNANGTVSKRYTKPGTINLADDYNVYVYDVAGHLTVDSQYTRPDPTKPYIPLVVTNFIYTGDNVTEAHYYRNISGVMTLEQKMKYDYDNGINPLKNADNYYSISEANSAMYDIRIMSVNNVIKEYAATGNGAYTLIQTYKYQYNSSKYPWKLKPEIISAGGHGMESEFFYE